MKASELRIGNLVFQRTKDVFKFNSVLLVQLDLWNETKYSKKPPCSPIPFTKEWFLKFGGKTDEGNDIYLSLPNVIDMRLYIKDDHLLLCKGQICPIYEFEHIVSVHQLQNLYFVLTGEELIIK